MKRAKENDRFIIILFILKVLTGYFFLFSLFLFLYT